MRVSLFVSLLILSACISEISETEVVHDELTVSAIPRGSTWRYWDQGGDLGTSWRGTFDDASWSSGAGPLGYGESYLRTTVSAGPITTYFRATFTVADPAAISGMIGEVMYDDGFVVYLNGTEIQRRSMPSGTITAATLSTGHEAGNTYASFDWSARQSLLVAGTNTIAVEVHQASASSSDVVFDLGLAFQTSDMPPPEGDDIPRGSAWWYWDNGGNLGTSWRALAGAATGWEVGEGPLGYGESYLRTTVGNGGITAYFRREIVVEDPATVVSILGDVMYDDGFVVYLNGTEIQRGAMPSGTITATTLSTGHEASNSYATFDWTARKNLLVAGTNVIAVEVHQSSASSSDLVFDAAFWVETAAPPPAPVDLGGIAARSFWGHWDVSGEPAPDWKSTPSFDAPWDNGSAPLGFGESYVWNQLAPGRIAYYFKASFHTDNPSAVTRMFADLQYDDGAVVYLNGTEILRVSMPAGTITPTTQAIGHEAAADTYESFDVTSKRHLLRAGLNVVAVEVHQSSPSSSDLVFDMQFQLRGEQPPPPSDDEDIARRSTWAYWDRTAAPSTEDDWTDPDYNDAVWERGAGPLGYGESYLGTTIDRAGVTAYFRRWFTVDDPSAHTSMILELMWDDGVVVWLNGHEVKRMQMGGGSDIRHDTLAVSGHEAGNRYEVFDLSAFKGHLRRGTNLLAVEVHQQTATSSDLVFDLALQIDTPQVCAIPGGGPGIAPLATAGITDVWVGATTVFATASDGTIGRRASDGSWCWSRAVADGAPWSRWNAVWGSADDDVWFVGTSGVAHYDGAAFARIDIGTTRWLDGIWGSGPDDIWIVGNQGTVRHFDGTSWQARDLPSSHDLFGIWGASADDVRVVGTEIGPLNDNDTHGSSGVIYRWDPATSSWNLELRNTMTYGFADFLAIDGTSPTDIWAIGYDHPYDAACIISVAYRHDGTSWSSAGGDATACYHLRDVAAGAPGAEDGAWIVGLGESGPSALRYTGGAWEDFPSPDGFSGLDHEGDRLYGVGGGVIYDESTEQFIVRWDGSGFVREW